MEERTLFEMIHLKRRTGGHYGSLGRSPCQPTFYISHSIKPDDTLQRLALEYDTHIQEIKRVNKLWSDAELASFEHVYVPVNASQLSNLRTLNPRLTVVQNLASAEKNHLRDSSTDSSTTKETSCQELFVKIDQQIQSSKESLQSLDLSEQTK